jgi:hypothetical protein
VTSSGALSSVTVGRLNRGHARPITCGDMIQAMDLLGSARGAGASRPTAQSASTRCGRPVVHRPWRSSHERGWGIRGVLRPAGSRTDSKDDDQLGKRFNVRIESSNGHVKVWHNGELRADLLICGAHSYFKAGAHVSSNNKGASDEGQVVIYDLKISHEG